MKRDISHFSVGERAVLDQLFVMGPTWDSNIVSKQSCDRLIAQGYVRHWGGWCYLTEQGVELCALADLTPYATFDMWRKKQSFS